jgi:polysaccharide pyruvyl transferase WcaK-like protein
MNNIPYDVPGLWEDYVDLMQKKGIEFPRVAIHGGYGKNNTGDDAILHVLITRTRKYLPKAQITVICHGPDKVRSWYPEISACHFKSLSALRAILKSHIYFIGGGGIINRVNVFSGYQTFKIFDMKGKFLFFAAYLAKLFGAQIHFYAIGATSFPDPVVKLLARIVLAQADVVSVRDPLSIKNIRDLGVKRELIQVLDPALSLEPAHRKDATIALKECGIGERSRPLICLNMRYVRNGVTDNEKTVAEAAQLVQYLIDEKECDVLYIPISQHPLKHFEDDLDFGRKVKAGLRDISHFFLMEKYYHPTIMMAVLGEMDFCILERLHAVILASKMGVPFFAISYDDKVTEFVKLVGCENLMIDLAEFNVEKIREKIGVHIDRLHLNRRKRISHAKARG